MVVLIKEIYQAVDIPASVVKNMVAVLPDVVSNALLAGESVTTTVFGRFEVKGRAARTGRNPKADETVFILAQSKPVFTPTKDSCDLFGEAKRMQNSWMNEVYRT